MSKKNIWDLICLISVSILAVIVIALGIIFVNTKNELEERQKFTTTIVLDKKSLHNEVYLFNKEEFEDGGHWVYYADWLEDHISIGDKLVLYKDNGKWIICGEIL